MKNGGIIGEEELVDDDREIVVELNDYFCTVFSNELFRNNGDETMLLDKENQVEKMGSISFTDDDVIKAISEFKENKSAGLDEINSTYAINIKEIVAKPLRIIFNKSLEENEIPDEWKRANITPIFKKGDKSLVSNYRPVSLTILFCKVMEKLIKQNIDRHLFLSNFHMTSQHGFRKGRSCMSNLLISQFSIMNIVDEGGCVDIIYLDFQKAFDKVPHGNLIRKVKGFGIDDKVTGWIENWLKNRTQRVVINGVSSDWKDVKSGVPQGSILGPLLLTMYIEDIDEVLKSSNLLKFADDTKVWGRVNKKEDAVLMQDDLNSLCEWSKRNGMPFNVDKCVVMHIGKKNLREKYFLNGVELKCVKEEKDLGVFFSEDSKPSLHCNMVSKSASKITGLIRRKISNKSKEGMLILYKTLVRPIVDYCTPVWRPYLRKM